MRRAGSVATAAGGQHPALSVRGSVAYCSQVPWVFSGTVKVSDNICCTAPHCTIRICRHTTERAMTTDGRCPVQENIVFGQPYDEVWYREVVAACALEGESEW